MELAKELGFAHADYLLPWLTAEQWRDWQLLAQPPETDDPATWSPERISETIKSEREKAAQLRAKMNGN